MAIIGETSASLCTRFRRCAVKSRAIAKGRDRRAGADHGRAARGHLALVRDGAEARRPRRGFDFRQPGAVRADRGLRQLSAHYETDVAALAEIKADLVWAPSPAVMYPEGFATRIVPEGPALAGLEDKFRPHFFGGVATVVAKLFTQVTPDFAMFGEKDYQQLRVVTADGPRSRSAAQDRRHADRAREGRPRDVVAQRLSVGERAPPRRCCIAC